MLKELSAALVRAQSTLWQDALGAAALMVILFGGLHLPGLL
ncbi:hypothetical protein SAMN05444722_0759 [Rhodovulum sp. ES.010]|nr:hypothetical protein [Rhodovulum sp. ES.010]SIO18998.1 hypothetical protein SAMN05444722_0759 [Rhodovulum sp. ES.010]